MTLDAAGAAHAFSGSTEPARLRRATPEDSVELGRLHVAAWRESYRGIVPDVMLASLSIDQRAMKWQRILNQPTGHGTTAVYVVEVGPLHVGFASCGAQRTEHLREVGYDGEVSAIYILRSFQERGIGRLLMTTMAVNLAEQGFQAASLWVLRDNLQARRFYERIGGNLVADRQDIRDGLVLEEVAYGWSRIDRLSAAGRTG